jgi:hypothetical protein
MVGRPARVVVDDFVWDEDIEAHFARHAVSRDDVIAVAKGDFLGFETCRIAVART